MIIDKIENAISSAMREKNVSELLALRNMKTALTSAKTEKKAGPYTDEKELRVLQKLLKQVTENANIYHKNNRVDLANREEFEALVINRFLPSYLAGDELQKALDNILSKVEIKPANFGAVMKSIMDVGKEKGKLVDTTFVSSLIKDKFFPPKQ